MPDTSNGTINVASVTDIDGISRVWAVIKPPNFALPDAGTVLDLPTIDLLPAGGDSWTGTFQNFTQQGLYNVAVYATDMKGNTSVPRIIPVQVNSTLRHMAILVAGHSRTPLEWAAIETNITTAQKALTLQGYNAADDIRFLSPLGFLEATQAVDANLENLQGAINGVASDALDVIIYLAGSSLDGRYEINGTETLDPVLFDQWVDTLQNSIPGTVIVIMDTASSGNYIEALVPPAGEERIVIAAASGPDQSYLFQQDISFSAFFWKQIMNGVNVMDAFWHARNTMKFLSGTQVPVLDDNGNGVGSDPGDGGIASKYIIGMGAQYVFDEPSIGFVTPDQTLTGTSAEIVAADVTAIAGIDRVWAVFPPPPSSPVTEIPPLELIPQGDGTYRAVYDAFDSFGYYHVSVYALDMDGNISDLKTIVFYQPGFPDMYEEDDSHTDAGIIVINDDTPQHHNFNDDDKDWIKFLALPEVDYIIKATDLDSNCDVVISLYGPDSLIPVDSMDNLSNQQADEILDWTCPPEQGGVYFVLLSNKNGPGPNSGYFLEITQPYGNQGTILGRVVDAITGLGIYNARIRTKACSGNLDT